MQLFFKTLDGKTTIIIEVESLEQSVYSIKNQLTSKTQIPIPAQKLIFGGKILEDHLSLQYYNIQKEYTIHLALNIVW